MKLWFGLALVLASAVNFAQTPGTSTAPAPGTLPASKASAADPILPDLDRLQSAASQITQSLGRMRIERWKIDNNSKQQAQSNSQSIQRNITAALPGMINAVRSSPQDLTAQFRLYRNVNALYDVLNSLTESAGAFGSKGEFEALAQPLDLIDSVRHDLGDSVERLASSMQNDLGQLHAQLVAAQRAAAVAASPTKTTVVDDNEPPKKATSHKKKSSAPKPATTTPAPNPNSASQ